MIVRGIVYLILIIMAVRLFKSIRLSVGGKEKATTPSGEEMVKDPTCETYIPKTDAIKKKVGGETLFFCSQKCLDEYRGKNR